MKTLRVGVVGLGRIGQIHLNNLRNQVAGADIVATADPISDAGATYTSFEEFLHHKGMDAVVICSPTDEHASHVVASARAGKHVFCEKPLDLSIERVRETLEIVGETGVKLMLGFNRRFDASFAKVKALVSEGKVGKPHMIRITSRDPAPPPIDYIKHSGGLFLDMTIHDFDMARHLAGCEAVEIYARGSNLIDPAIGEAGDIDSAVCVLTFENGATAVIDNSRKAVYGYDQRVEVFGEKGMVAIGNETPDQHQLLTADGEQRPLPQHFFLERYQSAYLAEMQAFVQSVLEDQPVPVGGTDGLQALLLGLAAKESVATNQPVSLR